MSRFRLALALAALALPAATACGSGQSSTSSPLDVSNVAWKDMTKDQKKAFMKQVVTPRMKEMFQTFDATKYAEFDCTTCHGNGATDGTFDMPNPELLKIPLTQEGFMALANEHPKDVEFMAKQVKPTMAALLQMPEFDPSQPDKGGFGCLGCHTKAE